MKIKYVIVGETKTAIKDFDLVEDFLEFRRKLKKEGETK